MKNIYDISASFLVFLSIFINHNCFSITKNNTILIGRNVGLKNLSTIEKYKDTVVELDINSNFIHNIDLLAEFTKLRVLDLSHNQIDDLTPICNLIYLRELYLTDNKIKEIAAVSKLGNNLVKLRLDRNNIVDLSSLITLKKLIEVDLSFNKIANISPLKSLTKLQTIILSSNQLKSIDALESCRDIILLNIKSNRVTSIDILAKIPNIQRVIASNNLIQNLTINDENSFKRLTFLDLNSNRISNVLININLTKLTYLHLDYNEITSIDFGNRTPILNKLTLTGNVISSLANGLIGLPDGLEFLELARNQIKTNGQNDISNYQKLDIFSLSLLDLSENKITDLSKIRFLTNRIRNLTLFNNKINKVDFTHLNFFILKTLDLSHNHIEQIKMSNMTNTVIQSLETLNLSYNRISADITVLKYFTNLKLLKLNHNQIKYIEGFDKLIWLNELNLNSNRLNKPILQNLVKSLQNLHNLETLDLGDQLVEDDLNNDIHLIENLTDLKYFHFSNNKLNQLSFKDQSCNKNYTLNNIDLSYNNLKNISFLTILTKVTFIDLNFNQIEDISYLSILKNLFSLYLNGNRISNLEPLKNQTKLTRLEMCYNKIENITWLKNMNRLITFRLANNKITHIPIGFFDRFDSLTHLDLSSNLIRSIDSNVCTDKLKLIELSMNLLENVNFLFNCTSAWKIKVDQNKIQKLTQYSINFNSYNLRTIDLTSNPLSLYQNHFDRLTIEFGERLKIVNMDFEVAKVMFRKIKYINNRLHKKLRNNYKFYKSLNIISNANQLFDVDCKIQIEILREKMILLNLFYSFQVDNFFRVCKDFNFL